MYGQAPTTFWGNYEAVSATHANLNVAERLWTAWYAFMQNDILATGIMSFGMHEIVYFGRSLPFILMDAMPTYFKRYKIQNVSTPGSKCLCLLADINTAENPNSC